MTQHLHLRAVTPAEAHSALRAARAAVAAAGGWIVDARQLGGLAVVVQFEADRLEADALSSACEARDIVLDDTSIQALAGLRLDQPAAGGFHITLAADGTDQRVVIPAVPG
jgi:hypothetical protein